MIQQNPNNLFCFLLLICWFKLKNDSHYSQHPITLKTITNRFTSDLQMLWFSHLLHMYFGTSTSILLCWATSFNINSASEEGKNRSRVWIYIIRWFAIFFVSISSRWWGMILSLSSLQSSLSTTNVCNWIMKSFFLYFAAFSINIVLPSGSSSRMCTRN